MSDTQSARCGVGGSGFVRRLIDHPTIPDELRGDVARILDNLGIANAYIDELEARLATLEAENKSLRDRFSDADTERNAAQGGLKAAFARVAELEARCKRLEEAVSAYQAAYEPDGHVRPHDCFATGPKTGDPIQDLVACPGCFAARKAKEAKP